MQEESPGSLWAWPWDIKDEQSRPGHWNTRLTTHLGSGGEMGLQWTYVQGLSGDLNQ